MLFGLQHYFIIICVISRPEMKEKARHIITQDGIMTRGPNQKGTKLVTIDAQSMYVRVRSTEYRESTYVRRVQYRTEQTTNQTDALVHGTLTMVGMNGSSVPVLCCRC